MFWAGPTHLITTIATVGDNAAEKHTPPKPSVFFHTYTNTQYAKSKKRILEEANSTGWFTSVEGLCPEDLPLKFEKAYKDVLSLRRGGGYWIWKIAVSELAMDSMNWGDLLVYANAGCQINKEGESQFQEFLRLLQESPFDMIGFSIDNKEHVWTTEAIFQALNVSKDDPIRTSDQIMGGLLYLQKGNHFRQWFARVNQVLMQDPWLITDKYNDQTSSANPFFKENRHDQSIFSVTRKQGGCLLLPSKDYPPGNKQFPFWATRIRG